jgi:phosphatidylglycerol lysyltransferase
MNAFVTHVRAWLWRLSSFLWLIVLAIALYALHQEWGGFHLDDLNAELTKLRPHHLALAALFTLLSYLCNALMNLLSNRWAGGRAPLLEALNSSFIVSAFSMNAGGTVLGGGAVRLMNRERSELSPSQLGKQTLYAVVAGWTGHACACGLMLIVSSPPPAWLASHASVPLGVLLLVCALVVTLLGVLPHPWRSVFPELLYSIPTLVVSALDWVFAGLTLWVLVPESSISASSFIAVVVMAQALSAFTHVPGGIGVLEFTITRGLAGVVAAPSLAGALLAYRFLYYLLPFFIALLLLGWRELAAHREPLLERAQKVGQVWSCAAPSVTAWIALLGGFILLVSANTPIEPARRQGLADWLPLPFVETSHFISSLAGAVLIVLARGLQRRVHAAWLLTVVLTLAGAVFSLSKGFDWEEATLLVLLASCLLPYRRHFDRHSALFADRFSGEWWFLILGLVAIATWLGFFASRQTAYSHELWWQFSYEGDASRFLRGMVGAGTVLGLVALAQLLRPTLARATELQTVPWPEVEKLVATTPHSSASLALLGDKEFTFSSDRLAALMHADQGRTRVVMGDPIGDPDSYAALLWDFIEQAQKEGRRAVFYEISTATVPLFVDMGMNLYKLGEEARVNLLEFDITSTASKKLRHARNRIQREGFSFEIWDTVVVKTRLHELQGVSDEWLRKHHAKEKRFSLGCFDPEYLCRTPIAIIQKEGRVVAFANLWTNAAPCELSIDLMRYATDAPSGVMDCLFAELLLWGKAQGYAWFNLGMAPLSGLSAHALAPLWHRMARVVFRRGRRFYNFSGLREYKDKFHPEWSPRYCLW